MQQLQKTYSLPNCTLVLDGMSDPSASAGNSAMSILTNAACKFLGHEQVISGGSDFFNSLVPTVSRYAQEQLSGLKVSKAQHGLVTLERKETGRHQLSVASDSDNESSSQDQSIDLTTVQLFDLVEAVDQFLADRSTLPSKQLELQPISKRDVPSQTSLSQRAATPALGAVGLAAVAAALFALEVPEVRRPLDDGTPVAAETADGTDGVDALDSDSVTDIEFAAPPITDPDQLEGIRETVFETIDTAWNEYSYPTFTEDAVYRVSTSADGEIVGYRGVDDLAQTVTDELPLAKLLYTPPTDTTVTDEPLAQFRVTFTPDGQLFVQPWSEDGSSESGSETSDSSDDAATDTATDSEAADAADSEEESDTESSDTDESSAADDEASEESDTFDQAALDELTAGALTADLYNRIDQKWTQNPTFDEDLEFRVQVNIDSDVMSYEAVSAGAESFEDEIPLPDLKKPDATGDASDFKVIFKSNGILEVSPWEGSGE